MKKEEMISRLDLVKVPKNAYEFNSLAPESYLLNHFDNKWSLMYNERGNITTIISFATDEDLYEYFYKLAIEVYG